MRRFSIFVLLCVSVASVASGQQAASSAPSLPADAKPERVKVYAVGPDVTAPELLPLDRTPIVAETCKKNVDGKVVLAVIVDAKGNPRNLMFTKTVNADLDKQAYQIVSADRFKPGTKDGTPVAIAQSVEVDMQACIEQTEDNTGENTTVVRLISKSVQKFETIPQPPEEADLTSDITPSDDSYVSAYPLYRFGRDTRPPVVLENADAEYSDEARRTNYQGMCLVEMIVDKYGIPRQLRVVHPLGMGLDQNAIEAVRKFRFRPAMKNGEPVSVKLGIQVNFRLYKTPSKH
jgi:TonB family protein